MNLFDGGYPMGEEVDTSDLPGNMQEAWNQVMEALEKLYQAWCKEYSDGELDSEVDNLMQLYDEWLD